MRHEALSDLGEFKNGVNFKSDQMGRGVPLINVKDITNSHRIDVADLDLVEIEVDDEMFARDGDIFFVRSSVKLDGIALAAKLKAAEQQAIHCGFVIRFRPTSGDICSDYLLYLLKSPEYRERLKNLSSGAAIVNISQSSLKGLEIPLPPPNIQRKVADMLSAYDDLMENNRRRMELLEESAQQLYREWFVRLRFPGHEHTRIVDSVPEGWERRALAEMCESIDYGYTASAEPEEIGPRFLRITDIVPDFIDWSSVPHCEIEDERMAKFRLREGDIVIARTGATVGYAKRLHKRHPDAVFASYLVRLRLKLAADNLMVGVFVESKDYKSYVQSRIGGAAQPNANAKVLSAAEILIPPPLLQRAFREFVEPLIDQREILQMQNQKLCAARDLLLPRLMRGEIAV